MSNYLARLTSNVFNPFLVSFVVIILLAFESTTTTAGAFQWLAISIALSVLPIFIFIIFMVRIKKLDGIFVNPRQQRNKIYVLATVLAAIGVAILYSINAPKLLFVTFVAGLAAIIIFMSINLYWKISLHTGFIAAAVAILIIAFGAIAAWSAILIPLVGWARLKMRLHSPAQVANGAILAAGIVLIAFHLFGMIGN